MKNQNGGSRTDTLIKLVLVFFLSLLSFSVGTFVGKQFSDSQHKIADLETENNDRVTASIPETKAEPNQAISEEEIAKLSDEFVKKEKADPSPAAAPDSATAKNDVEGAEGITAPKKQVPDSASIHDEINSVAKRLAAGEARMPSSTVTPAAPKPKEIKGATSTLDKYTVQFAAVASEAEANKKIDELKAKGVSAFIVPADVNGKKWYRVSAGTLDDRKSAMEYRAKLIKDTGIESAIIQKIAK
jgi:cell division septation protein DedD